MSTPSFYKKLIEQILEEKELEVYVLTDDLKITKRFIVDEINNTRIKLFDLNWPETFYLLTQTKYIVGSVSTFTFLASMINKNLIKMYIGGRPKDLLFDDIASEDYLIYKLPYIQIIDDKKYILNYNKKLVKHMLKYRK